MKSELHIYIKMNQMVVKNVMLDITDLKIQNTAYLAESQDIVFKNIIQNP